MSSKREEEKNEKIIRGLMKLPPNRRCINCNSLGPQYVCTNFWTFICTPCSGIHREFTHRVKSVSMAKFTTQEVDSLQKGGNQRARELYLKSWDLQRHKHPDNSNVDKVREFIKSVYVNKKYALEKSPDRPPRDPQGLGIHEEEKRKASSYHSYSQSPPYDFQYEERRYGKHATSLTRKPGSDRSLYEGKLSSFLSPSRFSDHANDDSSRRDTGSPFSDTSRNMTSAFTGHHAARRYSDFRSNGGIILHPPRTVSSGSFGSFDSNSMSFKSINSMDLPEVVSEPEVSAEVSHSKSSSSPYPTQLSVSGTFGGLDLFSAPFTPQDVTSTPSSGSNSQVPGSSTQSVDLLQQSFISSVSTFSEQQQLQATQPSSPDLFSMLSQQQSAASSEGKTSNVVIPNNGGWATFGVAHLEPISTENSATVAAEQSVNEKIPGRINPFSLDQMSSYSTGHDPTALTHTFQHQGLEKGDTTRNSTPFWNAFEDLAPRQPFQNVLKSNEQVAEHCASDAGGYVGFSGYEILNDNGGVRALDQNEPSCSRLPSHFSMPLHNLAMVPPVAGVHPIAPDYKPSNPFDQPYDSDLDSNNMFWDMSSLQAALPSTQMPASYVGDHSNSWFPQDSTLSYVPGGVTFDHPHLSSLGLVYAEAPTAQLLNIPAPGPVGGNPFA